MTAVDTTGDVMSEVTDTFYYAGQEAFDRGEALLSCPHADQSAQWKLWRAGWDEGRRFLERDKIVLPKTEAVVI